MSTVYHLDLDKRRFEAQRLPYCPATLSGLKLLPKKFQRPTERSIKIGMEREFCTYLTEIKGEKLLITSTAIGGPSMSIVIDELAQLGIQTFIRVGTTACHSGLYRYWRCHYHIGFCAA